jgi:hypothetical protein
MPNMRSIKAESERGGPRPGAGAAPVPKARPPQTKPGTINPADVFRRAKRGVTHRGYVLFGSVADREVLGHAAQRLSPEDQISTECVVAPYSDHPAVRRIREHVNLANHYREHPSFGGAERAAAHAARARSLAIENGFISDPIRWLWPGANTSSTEAGDGFAHIIAGDAPDASAEFRSEFSALLAFYAARIAVARRSFSPSSVAAAIVQALMGEQAVALRGLMDRWHAASQKQRDEKPERPMQNVRRKDEDPRLS